MRKVLVYNGGAVALEPFHGGVGGGTNYNHQTPVVTKNNAQIKALPSGSVEVVAAVADHLLFVIWAAVTSRFTVPYADVDAGAAIGLNYGDNFGASTWAAITGWFDQAANPYTAMLFGGNGEVGTGAFANILTSAIPQPAQNIKLFCNNGQDFSGGDDENTLDIAVVYLKYNTTTGLFVAA